MAKSGFGWPAGHFFAPGRSLVARYSIGGKAPAVIADTVAGVYGLGGRSVGFDGLFTFSRLSAAWKRNALGHWVKVLAGEPRTGHHIWQGGQLVPAGQLVESATRTQEFSYSKLDDASLGSTFQTLGSDVTIQGGSTDIVTEVVATGTENGIPYIDWSVSGTNNAGTTQFYNVIDNRWVATSPGETYTISAYLKLISGSLGASTGTVQLYGHYRDAGNALIGQVNSEVISDVTDALQRFSGGGQAAPVGTVNLAAKGLFVRVPDGNSINIVLRIGLPQVESGGVSTSPIVSTGSPVSVAAEIQKIDSVKLAKAVGVFGTELVDTTWSNYDLNTLVADGDQLTLTRQIGASEAVATSNTETLTAGETYLLSIPILSVTNNFPVGVYHGTTQIAQSDEAGTLEVVYTPEATITDTFTLRLRGSNAVQSSAVIKQPSLRPVTMPEALTFLMKGTVTYEDEDSFNTVRIIYQRVSSDDYIEISLDTSGVETGEVNFKSRTEGGFTNTKSATDAYAPGTEVPFSIALVVTADDVEGFCNGVSTGQIAHGGMANLLSAPLQLFQTGNATIKDFRIWPEALPSADMLEATG